jgi:hypothetical protein
MPDKAPEQVLTVVKEWASPVLMSILGMLIWRDMTELRTDVKLMLIQQSSDRVKILNLEADVQMLKQSSYFIQRYNEKKNNSNEIE